MEGKKMTFGRGLKWVLCCLLIGAVIGGSFGVGYTLSKQPQETNHDGASYMLKDNGYTGNSDQNLLANPLVGEQVKQVTEEVKDAVVVIITRAQRQSISNIAPISDLAQRSSFCLPYSLSPFQSKTLYMFFSTPFSILITCIKSMNGR